jgi:1-acyl-sn-glycerol-3-phosphate acyltransferase
MRTLRLFVIMFVLQPLARIFTGVDVLGREKLPLKGPAIIAANHNSHVDTLLLLTIFPPRSLSRLRPAAAADYFLRGPVISWFSRNILGIVPVERDKAGSGEDVLAPARQALLDGDIILIFPEGTRGDSSDELARLKSGVARLAEGCPQAPVIPIWLEGAGRVLPKGALVPVPMNCTVVVGDPLVWTGERRNFMDRLRDQLLELRAKAPPQRWRPL